MIHELTVENLAIIERAQVALGPGFTVLTGETGAGKSLLVDAIQLALGDRADSDLVRTGCRRASVSVVLQVERPELAQACEDAGFPLEDGRLFIQREVSAEGRSQCRLNGRMAPVGTLKVLGKLLVDLHGQHDHQSLFDPLTHLEYLDQWIGAEALGLRDFVAESYGKWTSLRTQLDAARRGQREREQRLDLLRFQIREIEDSGVRPGESEELAAQLSRMKNAERLRAAAASALEELAEAEVNAVDLVGAAARQIGDGARLDADLDEIAEGLEGAVVRISEAVHGLRGYLEDLDADPDKLEETAARQDLLKRLQRKYGESDQAVLDHLARAQEELSQLEEGGQSEEELASATALAETILLEIAGKLSQLRADRAKAFSASVQAQLHDLALEKAVLTIRQEVRAPDASGIDQVEFLFSANAGESARPLAKIASGGEISRVMLALKTALAGKAGVPTLIFDEVDAGLSGKAAAKVALKIAELSKPYQVVVISHLPQIAARADVHFRIVKTESAGRVATDVVLLDPAERVEEIARLLAGEHVTDSARQNARELLS